MTRGIALLALLALVQAVPQQARAATIIHPNAMSICAIIISELTEGKVTGEKARDIALAIAQAGNKHFGKVTCGDMWLYMAIVHVESGFRNNVVNEYNCRGMFQVHAPSWARKFGIKYADLLDLRTNADIGIQVFKYYLQTYKKLVPALSAYNSDHPQAATGYARAVLGTQKKIKKRYTQLYNAFRLSKTMATLSPGADQSTQPDRQPESPPPVSPPTAAGTGPRLASDPDIHRR